MKIYFFFFGADFFFAGFFLSGACVNAEPATDFWSGVDFLFLSCLDAFLATRFEVFSFLAIIGSPTNIELKTQKGEALKRAALTPRLTNEMIII